MIRLSELNNEDVFLLIFPEKNFDPLVLCLESRESILNNILFRWRHKASRRVNIKLLNLTTGVVMDHWTWFTVGDRYPTQRTTWLEDLEKISK